MSTGHSQKFQGNEMYRLMLPQIKKIRDCVAGEFFVKLRGSLYLPHPSSVDKTSPEQQERYRMFIANAEFDEFPESTERTMLGKLKLDDMKVELDSRLDYLINDVDGDGLSLKGLVESCAKNTCEVKWHCLLTDYQGLSDLDINNTSAEELSALNPRATIKQYSRENVLDWSFSRINGATQLTYLLLQEISVKTDPDTMLESKIVSWLKLGIDEYGYYQQKYVSLAKQGEISEGEKNYIFVSGSPLQYIPATFASDEELPLGDLPPKMGFLNAICDLALARYRTNAKYKEALDGLQPMINVYGVNASDWEEFTETNDRTYVAVGVGSPNVFRNSETKVEMLSTTAAFEPWEKEFDKNTKTVRALGGTFKTDIATQRTATEIVNESENQVSVLYPMIDSIEQAIKTSIWYAGVFEGVYSKDDFKLDNVELELARDLEVTKLSVDEVKTLSDLYVGGLLPKDEILRILELGGWTTTTAEELLVKLDEGL